jgi:hypothetical protein
LSWSTAEFWEATPHELWMIARARNPELSEKLARRRQLREMKVARGYDPDA